MMMYGLIFTEMANSDPFSDLCGLFEWRGTRLLQSLPAH